jgi:hypothetical protein
MRAGGLGRDRQCRTVGSGDKAVRRRRLAAGIAGLPAARRARCCRCGGDAWGAAAVVSGSNSSSSSVATRAPIDGRLWAAAISFCCVVYHWQRHFDMPQTYPPPVSLYRSA